jgi:PAS domain S-box-containing protein
VTAPNVSQREDVIPGLDQLPCGIVSFRDDGRVVQINATLLEVLGLSREEVEGQHVEKLLTVAGRIFLQTHLYPLVRLGQPAEEMFVLLRHKDGRSIGTLMNARRRETSSGAMVDAVFMEVRERSKFEEALLRAKRDAEAANDALRQRSTELEGANQQLEEQAAELEIQQDQLHEQATEMEEQAERMTLLNEELIARSRELERARSAAEEANKAKSQFLAVMSHELRTPLNAIGGYVQLIEMGIHGPTTAGQLESLDRILRAQRHLLRLINDVLNLSRIEAGRVDYRIEVIAVREAFDSVIPMVEPQMEMGGLELASEAAPDLTICADREKVQQILINLLTNAVATRERS